MIGRFFELDQRGTTFKRECLAGFTTFITMAYIVVVNPKILEVAGIPAGASMVATVLSAFFGTLLMGVYAKRPIAIAPYMGENAFIAFTVVKVLHYSWQTALGAIFISGVLFTLVTVLRIRSWFARGIPESLKISFSVGIGLFLTFIGLHSTGIVALGIPGAPVHVGHLSHPRVLLAIAGTLVIAGLMIRRVPGAILIGIITITVAAFAFGLEKSPQAWVSLPPDLSPTLFAMDIMGACQWGMLSVILTIFVMAFVDTMGTLFGLAYKAEMFDADGNIPDIDKPMLCDALATTMAPVLGTTTSGAFIESAAGIAVGGRTGLTAVVTAFCFLGTLFFNPFFAAVPAYACGPALILIGGMMLAPLAKMNFDDLTELVPAFFTLTLMSFTYNVGVGMTAGFVAYPVLKIMAGRIRDISPAMWVFGAVSLLFYIFYPYPQ